MNRFMRLTFAIMLLLLSIPFSRSQTVSAASDPTDRAALVAFYNSTNGLLWLNKTNWLSESVDHCNWHGITCNQAERVTKIELEQNNLTGSLPTELGNLSELTTLDVSLNIFLGGSIPASITNLSQLSDFDLALTAINGPLPANFTTLTNLTKVRVGGSIAGTPGNSISGSIPTDIDNLTRLNDLILSSDNLTGTIPNGVANLNNLTRLVVGGDNLSGPVPTDIYGLTGLTEIGLWVGQGDTQIPLSVNDLSNLVNAGFTGAGFSGELPNTITQIATLEQLFVLQTRMSGELPPNIGSLSNLTTLNIVGNAFSGEVPASIANLTAVTDFDIRYNRLTASGAAKTYLDSKQATWASTQTVPPGGLSVTGTTDTTAALSWDEVVCGGVVCNGYTIVSYRTAGTSEWAVAGQTSDKFETTFTVNGLSSGTDYEFAVQSYTPAHTDNPNNLTSLYSAPVSGTTTGTSAPVINAVTLSAPVGSISAGPTVTLQWPHQPDVQSYHVDVYDPFVQIYSDANYSAGSCTTVCELTVTINSLVGDYDVWIQGKAGETTGPWALSEFTTLIGTTSVISPTGTQFVTPTVDLLFPRAAGAAYYVLDVYRPVSGFERFIVEDNTCTGENCTLAINTNNETGLYDVWIIPGVGGTFGNWQNTQFTLEARTFAPVTLSSPTGTRSFSNPIDLVFNLPDGAYYVVVDVYYPNGGYLRDVVEAPACPGGVCTLSLNTFDLSGAYSVWMIPGWGNQFGQWANSTFDIAPFMPTPTAGAPLGAAVEALPASTPAPLLDVESVDILGSAGG